MTRVRVVLGTFGFDQHEVGARLVASYLRDAGAEVVYVGRFNLPDRLLATALDEDAQVIAVSCHSWEYLAYAPELVALIAASEAPDLRLVIGGSVITPDDAARLREQGVAAVLGSGATRDEVVDAVLAAAGA